MLLVGVVLAVGFVLAPLFRSEADLEPLRRQRPGTRHLHGLEGRDREVADHGERVCQRCGANVNDEYTYCRECLTPVV